jgi:magnesium-dependent phosphatase-1
MVLDSRNWEVELFPHVAPLFQAFKDANVKLALASRTEEPEWAEEIIHTFRVGDDTGVIVDFTHAREIYPTSKVGRAVLLLPAALACHSWEGGKGR